MKRISFCILSIIVLSSFQRSTNCGTYRWAVKTCTDVDGRDLYYKPSVKWLIEELDTVTRPPETELTESQRARIEKKVIRLNALVIAFKRDNSKVFQILLKSLNSDSTIMAEIPDNTCSTLKYYKELALRFGESRNHATAALGMPSLNFTKLKIPVKVTVIGVLFFNKKTERRETPNGVELFPLFKFDREL